MFTLLTDSRWPRVALITALCSTLTACNTMPGTASNNPASSGDGVGGCERLSTTSNATKMAIGAAVGAVAGYAIGNATAGGSKGHSRTVGALGGALAGALAGSAFKNEIDVEEQADGSVKLKIPGSIMFASGQHSLSPAFRSTLSSVTTTIKKYCDLSVRVVGHTDSVGSQSSNMALSQNRARSVVQFMGGQGFERSRMTFDGAGPNQPIASNGDEAGRQLNRRVEIFVRPPA